MLEKNVMKEPTGITVTEKSVKCKLIRMRLGCKVFVCGSFRERMLGESLLSEQWSLLLSSYGGIGVITLLALAVGYVVVSTVFRPEPFPKSNAKSIFDFTVESGKEGKSIALSSFRGKKAYLLVNVASK